MYVSAVLAYICLITFAFPTFSIGSVVTCSHVTTQEANRTFSFIKENFPKDIKAYMKSGLLSESPNGPQDCEKWAAAELFERAERKINLKKALQDLENEWPPIVKEGSLKRVYEIHITSDSHLTSWRRSWEGGGGG